MRPHAFNSEDPDAVPSKVEATHTVLHHGLLSPPEKPPLHVGDPALPGPDGLRVAENFFELPRQ